jgi:hypothetical protein
MKMQFQPVQQNWDWKKGGDCFQIVTIFFTPFLTFLDMYTFVFNIEIFFFFFLD